MSENENRGYGRGTTDPNFSARGTNPDPLDNMLDGRDDPNRGPLDRAANALDGHDDPNRGPVDRMANAIDGRDDPNRGPVDRMANAVDGYDDPNRGPVDRMANALDGRDDPNRGPLDRAANAIGGGTGGVAAATGAAGATAMTGNRSMVSAVFDTHEEAQRAVTDLRSAGVSDSALSIIAHHGGTTTTTSGDGEITDESRSSLIRGILGGGALGAGLGILALAIPGVGPLTAAGAIAASAVPEAAAIGAAVGAAAGTLNEVLGKHGVNDEDAAYYGERLKSGGVFVSVDTSASSVSAEMARDILDRNGGHNSARARTA